MNNISLTGVLAASRDLSVVSNNLANAMTTGFKRSTAVFSDVAQASAADRPAFQPGQGVLTQEVSRSTGQGGIMTSESGLDLAISGQGYFVFGDANNTEGEAAYTYSRAGKLTLNAAGFIIDGSGAPLMGLPVIAGNAISGTPAPINLTAAAGGDTTKIQSVGIDGGGVVSVQLANGQSVKVAAVALASFRNERGLKSQSGARLSDTDASGPPEFHAARRDGLGEIRQGALEGANVDLTNELLSMVRAQQAYNGNARALQTGSEMVRSVIETLTR